MLSRPSTLPAGFIQPCLPTKGIVFKRRDSPYRFTAAHAGFFDLSQSGERPEREAEEDWGGMAKRMKDELDVPPANASEHCRDDESETRPDERTELEEFVALIKTNSRSSNGGIAPAAVELGKEALPTLSR
jgi:hypothetical protein